MRAVKDISSALDEFLKDFDKDIWVEMMIHRNWKKIGGKRKPSSIKFRGGVLRVSVFDSTLRNYLVMNSSQVLKIINGILGEELVKDIEIFGVQAPIFRRFSSPLEEKKSIKSRREKK